MTDGPLLTTGCYRSGSTFAALSIQNHPQVEIGLHISNAPRWIEEAADEQDFARLLWEHAYQRFGSEYIPEWRVFWNSFPNEYRQPWWKLMEIYAERRGGATVIGEKTNLDTNAIPQFLEWFPGGKAISVVRDPRSILASFREYDHHDPPVYLQAAFVALASMQQSICLNRERSNDEFRVIQYEQLAQHPVPVLHDAINWLGLDWPGANVMLDQSDWADIPGSKWEDRSSFSDADDIDVDAAVNRWRGRLSDTELRFVETICSDAMEHFGYERESTADLRTSQLQGLVYGEPKGERMLNRWLRTGEGTEEFPDDPTDKTSWRSHVMREAL